MDVWIVSKLFGSVAQSDCNDAFLPSMLRCNLKVEVAKAAVVGE